MSGGLGHEIEIVLTLGVFTLHDLGVDQAARGRVHQATAVILQEEPLSDPLVDDDDCDVRLLFCGVVGLPNGLS